ncbi:hypothetical protein SAMN02746041_02486 [Desulfacinum hydrothermale DSM 13146]|uniref:Uncharacterized protein n=1 Tax=Desulfacinum hydrothermale DSM 13146 TaxID=1121390 RepID=A0A1W1XQ59_9BACT|nr:YeeE/YedE thiosulfate transporter family protein [Desulfacinum hydrothermale]SMC25985.1 hypothetical protein SAMN02746041_02486 [Desulfacinum hydrothermale DSM 13146]
MDHMPTHQNEHRREATFYWPVLPAALALAGVIVFIFATFGPPASSSGFVSLLKGLLGPIFPDYIAHKEHYRIIPGPGSWLFAFVLGMATGGYLGGLTLGKPLRKVPALWERRFGARPGLRYAACFLGGFLILFGARLAGGCTLGLFISGSTQLAVSGLYFGIVIFAVAMLTSRLVYGSQKGDKK